jgi:hypothetical protein
MWFYSYSYPPPSSPAFDALLLLLLLPVLPPALLWRPSSVMRRWSGKLEAGHQRHVMCAPAPIWTMQVWSDVCTVAKFRLGDR